MSEEKDDKKDWWETIRGIIPNALVQIKNQLGEDVKGVEIKNLNVIIPVIKDNKIENVNVHPEIPPNTNYENLAQLLDQYLARIEQLTPEIQSFEIPEGKDIKWATDVINTAVSSSAATLSTIASTEIEFSTGKFGFFGGKDEEGEMDS